VDEILPLSITPTPAIVARAFVGRLEVITPEVEDDVETAVGANDMKRLVGYGRFLDPIAQRIMAKPRTAMEKAQIQEALRLIVASRQPEVSCR
jgi:hypothetical protein